MSKLESKGLVPELRFSQFIGGTEWQKKPFNKLYTLKVTNSLSRDKLNYDDGIVKNIHYGDIHTKFSTLFDITKEYVPFINTEISLDKVKEESYCLERDMVFADASEDIDDVGKSIELTNLNGEKLLSGLHTILARPKKNDLVKGFGGYLFKSEVMRKQIQKESQGAKVLGISGSRISNIDVIYPIDHDEQQKIADCLSSMDNLIETNTKKLELLKSHKKGLMQKIFPEEGKSVPELRFDGFEGEWTVRPLDTDIDVIDGDRGVNYPKQHDFSKSGYCLFLNAKNVTKTGFKFNEVQFVSKEKDEKLNKGKLTREDVILTTRGSVGQFAYYSEEVLFEHVRINSGMVILSSKNFEIISPSYLYIFSGSSFCSEQIANMAFGNAQQQLTVSGIKKMSLSFPKREEQKKIVDCISSINILINRQTEKIETLKSYKKGLMQQLFPDVKESIA
ncbi:restriction endonuclease subunit S [Vibrio parahaemolyticus]